jgi:hypothetical protein
MASCPNSRVIRLLLARNSLLLNALVGSVVACVVIFLVVTFSKAFSVGKSCWQTTFPLYCILFHCPSINGNARFLCFCESWLEPVLQAGTKEEPWVMCNHYSCSIQSNTVLIKCDCRLKIPINFIAKHQRHTLDYKTDTLVIQLESLLEEPGELWFDVVLILYNRYITEN